jgi:hypothetical protein
VSVSPPAHAEEESISDIVCQVTTIVVFAILRNRASEYLGFSCWVAIDAL